MRRIVACQTTRNLGLSLSRVGVPLTNQAVRRVVGVLCPEACVTRCFVKC